MEGVTTWDQVTCSVKGVTELPRKLDFFKRCFFLNLTVGESSSNPTGVEFETQVLRLWSLSLSYVNFQLDGSASLANVAQLF